MQRIRKRRAASPLFGGASVVLYDRLSSNNSARIRIWLYYRGLENAVTVRSTLHAEQRTEEFRRTNPFQKIPALIIRDHAGAETTQWLAEAAIILEFLEHSWAVTELVGAGKDSLVPTFPRDRAHMNLVIRTHDLYLASPNCTQPGPFTHTQVSHSGLRFSVASF